MTENGWNELHSKFTCAFMAGGPNIPSTFSKGGLNINDDLTSKEFEEFKDSPQLYKTITNSNLNRLGFIGWHGQGGCVMQWHV